tara:strand:+ start:670 stop:882 length:213 start_codon:yes stop_codon:yes gene_type:complete
MIDKKVAKEAVWDVGIGFLIAFPLSYVVLSFATWFELSISVTAVVQTLVFTVVALTRKYFVRLFFKKNGD